MFSKSFIFREVRKNAIFTTIFNPVKNILTSWLIGSVKGKYFWTTEMWAVFLLPPITVFDLL